MSLSRVILITAIVASLAASPARAQSSPSLSPSTATITIVPPATQGQTAFTLRGAPGAPFVASITPPQGTAQMLVSPSQGTIPSSGVVTLTVQAIGVSRSGTTQLVVLYYSQPLQSIVVVNYPDPIPLAISPASFVNYFANTNQPIRHQWRITNTHNAPLQVNLALGYGGDNWPTTASYPPSVTLAPGASVVVPVTVTRPTNAVGRRFVRLIAQPYGYVGTVNGLVAFSYYRSLLAIIRRQPQPPSGVDAFEPDNSCSQHSTIAVGNTQQRTYYVGTNTPDTDIVRMTLDGGTTMITYTLRVKIEDPSAASRLVLYYMPTNGCGTGSSISGIANSTQPYVDFTIELFPSTSSYQLTMWLSSTHPLNQFGPNQRYSLQLVRGILPAPTSLEEGAYPSGATAPSENRLLVSVGAPPMPMLTSMEEDTTPIFKELPWPDPELLNQIFGESFEVYEYGQSAR